MSLVKHVEIQCDLCRRRLPWSNESVANTCGITKGDIAAPMRAEADASGWTRLKSRAGHWIDLCQECQDKELPVVVWFEAQDVIGEQR